jgi:hypothetical protein
MMENSHSCQGACCNDETGKALQADRPLKELKAADWGVAAEVELRSKLLEPAIDAAIAITISKALPRTLPLPLSRTQCLVRVRLRVQSLVACETG